MDFKIRGKRTQKIILLPSRKETCYLLYSLFRVKITENINQNTFITIYGPFSNECFNVVKSKLKMKIIAFKM